MNHKITKQNLYNFIQGNGRMLIKNSLAEHIKEQIAYRMLLCKDDCAKNKMCIKCGCDYPGRIYTSQSCNEDRFPNLMSRIDWENFKKENNIE